MASSPEIQPIYIPGPEDFMKMRRVRRFRSEPDHATKGSLFRSPEKTEELIKVIRHKAEAGRKAAIAHIQEAIHGELTDNVSLEVLPDGLTEQPAAKPEPLLVPLVELAPNLRQLATS